jgi:hypothetical protein
MAVQQGCDPAIALLVYYAISKASFDDIKSDLAKNQQVSLPPSSLTAKVHLGDDEVMVLSNVNSSMLYAFIDGSWEMERLDQSNEALYSSGCGYEQKILSSYRTTGNSFNFANFLVKRFHSYSYVSEAQRIQGSIGSSTKNSCFTPIYLSSTIGWAKILTNELTVNGKFLSLPF